MNRIKGTSMTSVDDSKCLFKQKKKTLLSNKTKLKFGILPLKFLGVNLAFPLLLTFLQIIP